MCVGVCVRSAPDRRSHQSVNSLRQGRFQQEDMSEGDNDFFCLKQYCLFVGEHRMLVNNLTGALQTCTHCAVRKTQQRTVSNLTTDTKGVRPVLITQQEVWKRETQMLSYSHAYILAFSYRFVTHPS